MAMPRPRTPVGMLTAVGITLLLAAAVLAVVKQEGAALIFVLLGAVVMVAVTVLEVRQNHAGSQVGRQGGGRGADGRDSSTEQAGMPSRPGSGV